MDYTIRCVASSYSSSSAGLPFTPFLQIKYGVMFDAKESEGTKRRHQVDTVVEGMYVTLRTTVVIEVESQTNGTISSGINRLTRNMQFGLPLISDAFRYASNPSFSYMPHLTKPPFVFDPLVFPMQKR